MPSDLDLFERATRAKVLSNPTYMKFGSGATGILGVFARMTVWNHRFLNAMKDGMREWAAKVESDMKAAVTWTDRTGHAKNALRAYLHGDDPRRPEFANVPPPTVKPAKGELVVVVTGFMDYNVWLEIRWSGRFAVMWPTVVRNASEFARIMVKHGRSVT